MAIQAQMYPENLGLPLTTGGGGSQDWLFMSNNFNNNNNNNNNMFLNGCGFNEFSCNNLQQQKQQQQYQIQQHQQQQQQQQQQPALMLQLQQQYMLQLQNQQQRNSSCENNNNNDGFAFLTSSRNCTSTTTASTTTSGSDYQMPMNFSPSFADQLEKQRQEMDRLITLQNERLKLALQEQRKQQLGAIMRKLEAKAMQLLRQKDEEIARATKRTMELEEIIGKMEMENLEWQRLAAENEAMVVSLNNTLEQLKDQACCVTSSSSSNEVDDAESICNVNINVNENHSKKRRREEKTGEVAETGEEGEKAGMVLCRVCKSGNSCVLLLPCRHLCCCKACEALVDACPVCKSAKMASIEALVS